MKSYIKRRSSWGFLLFEFLVVFIGIYGAFYLTTLREEQIEHRNQVNYYKTFMLNLEYLNSSAEAVKEKVDSVIEKHKKSEDAEIVLIREIDFTNNMLIVRSGFEAENFTTIGQEYLASLDRGSNLISLIEKRANILEEETRTYLIYGEGRDKEFRRWYLSELESLSELLSRLQATITRGAVPETKNIIELMERGN